MTQSLLLRCITSVVRRGAVPQPGRERGATVSALNGSERKGPSMKASRLFTLLGSLAVLISLGAGAVRPGAAHAGAAPNLLDRNTGIVVHNPKIVNLYWDGNWDGDNPSFHRSSIDNFTRDLVGNSHYLATAGQYGVGPASFGGSFTPSWLCGASRSGSMLSSATLAAWVTCEVLVPGTGVPYPDINFNGIANTLYVVYLPHGTRINDTYTLPAVSLFGHTYGPYTIGNASCSSTTAGGYGGYHAFSFGGTNAFAWAVVVADCAQGSFGSVTGTASHEIAEASVDPYPTASWINSSLPSSSIFSDGEAGDICENRSSPNVTIDSFVYARYWSNRDNACKP